MIDHGRVAGGAVEELPTDRPRGDTGHRGDGPAAASTGGRSPTGRRNRGR